MRGFPLVVMVVMALSSAVFFVHGLRTRKAVVGAHLVVDRDRDPVLYFIAQCGWASGVATFCAGMWLATTGHSMAGYSDVDKLIISIWGLTFLLFAVMMGVVFTIGLRTGVADSRSGDIKRAKHPVQYWAMEALYVVALCLSAALGLGIFVVVFLK